jgi:hypothetical protein
MELDRPDSPHAPPPSSDSNRRLCICLADHRAGVGAGRARARRVAAANANNSLRDAANDVYRQIEEDAGALDPIRDRLGCRPSRWKVILAQGAELAGRLTPNGQLREYSPLSRAIKLEWLIAGLLTKKSLWQILAVLRHRRSELGAFDFDKLERRAMQQQMQLESHRSATVNEAFGQ